MSTRNRIESTAHLIAALAAPTQGMLHLLRVVDLPPTEGRWRSHAYISATLREQAQQEAETYLEAQVDSLRRSSLAALKLTVTWSVVASADVAGTIITQAEQQGYCDLIAMTTHGRRGLHHFMMGSVTEQVLDHTRLPLLAVRPQRERTAIGYDAHDSQPHGL